MAKQPDRNVRSNRPIAAHTLRVLLTAEEFAELQTIATLERATYSDTVRKAVREYAGRVR